jgi:hypothetical protein
MSAAFLQVALFLLYKELTEKIDSTRPGTIYALITGCSGIGTNRKNGKRVRLLAEPAAWSPKYVPASACVDIVLFT